MFSGFGCSNFSGFNQWKRRNKWKEMALFFLEKQWKVKRLFLAKCFGFIGVGYAWLSVEIEIENEKIEKVEWKI